MIDIVPAYETAAIKPSERRRTGTKRCQCGRIISLNKFYCLACAEAIIQAALKQAQAEADSCK